MSGPFFRLCGLRCQKYIRKLYKIDNSHVFFKKTQKVALANSSAIYILFGKSTSPVAGIFILWLKAALGWVRVALKKCFLRYTLGTSGCPKSVNTVEVFAPFPLSTYLSTMLLLNALCGHGCILRSGSLTRASQPDSNSDPAPQPQIQFQASNLARRP